MATATAMIEDLKAKGYSDLGEVDQVTVDTFVSQAAQASNEQLQQVIDRMLGMVRRNETARGTNLPTMAATADKLAEILAAR